MFKVPPPERQELIEKMIERAVRLREKIKIRKQWQKEKKRFQLVETGRRK